MNYQIIYDALITNAKKRASSKDELNALIGYSEAHHIIPRCLGGTDDLENIVHLSAREHFVAHQLLVKIYPGNSSLVNAAYLMGNTRITHITYEWIKRQHAKVKSIAYTGRTKHTHEYLRLNGIKRSLLNLTNCQWIRKMADRQRGRTKETNDGLARTSQKQLGRTKEEFDYLLERSEYQKTLTKLTNEGRRIMARKISVLSEVQELELVKLKDCGLSNKEIHKLLSKRGIKIAYSTISTIYRRIKFNDVQIL